MLTDDEFSEGRRYGCDGDRDRGEHMPGTGKHDGSAGPLPQHDRRELTSAGRSRVSAGALVVRRAYLLRPPPGPAPPDGLCRRGPANATRKVRRRHRERS